MTTAEVEYAAFKHVAVRHGRIQELVVPNVRDGMGFPFECDLLYVTKTGYAHEIEIKVSRSDLMRDKKKQRHAYEKYMHDPIIRSKTFAIPEELASCVDDIPAECGVIVVYRNPKRTYTTDIRKAVIDTRARKLTAEELMKMYRLMAMRVWTMKKKLLGVK